MAKTSENCLGPLRASFNRPSDQVGGGWLHVPKGNASILRFEEGNKNETDMCVVLFRAWLGGAAFTSPVPPGLPHGRKGNGFYFKSNAVASGGHKGRHVIAIDFDKEEDVDEFEQFFQCITGSENSIESKAPSEAELIVKKEKLENRLKVEQAKLSIISGKVEILKLQIQNLKLGESMNDFADCEDEDEDEDHSASPAHAFAAAFDLDYQQTTVIVNQEVIEVLDSSDESSDDDTDDSDSSPIIQSQQDPMKAFRFN